MDDEQMTQMVYNQSAATWRDHEPAPPAEPRTFTRDDYGLGERLAFGHGDKLRYVDVWGTWLVWDGTRWLKDATRQVDRCAKETARRMLAEAASCKDDTQRKALAEFAAKAQTAYRKRVMINNARAELPIAAHPDDFDQDRWKLNCLNCTVDLTSGEPLPHQQSDMITKLAPTIYDPTAEAPLWHEFLNKILDGNADLMTFLQRAVGYSLTGDTSEQCFFVLYGSGANGKSTFLNTIMAMLGDYARQTPTETLLLKRNDNIPNDVARLRGARLVAAIEANQGRRLAESLVKAMTGGDRIPARFLHAEWFEFIPTFKLFLATNHKPQIRGTDNAIWRRIRLVPFTVTIPEPEQDKHLGDKLLSELPGILTWAVQGCLDWQENGLGTPQEVRDATEAYRLEQDQLGDFLDDWCIIHPNTEANGKRLYENYKQWADKNGEKAMPRKQFTQTLQERGITKERRNDGYWYIGVGLTASAYDDDERLNTDEEQEPIPW